ncbi:unnamed protein product [Zymoseptoria tritici ST99CH_3D7]|uniref:Uncharacterized protein n=1 Tax=Zymoseptoria tritici (strain ST99CH_3D7) TaxID=1276538 RepID=A0A1X7RZG5_ZYMT9|nr:unnamed protein product [Zymoseptoria tritici ST99CH_3D7]
MSGVELGPRALHEVQSSNQPVSHDEGDEVSTEQFPHFDLQDQTHSGRHASAYLPAQHITIVPCSSFAASTAVGLGWRRTKSYSKTGQGLPFRSVAPPDPSFKVPSRWHFRNPSSVPGETVSWMCARALAIALL